jgi:hypothetical protein
LIAIVLFFAMMAPKAAAEVPDAEPAAPVSGVEP